MRTWPVFASWTMPAMRPPALAKSRVGCAAAVVIKSLGDCEGVGARAAKSPLAERGGGLGSESCGGFRSPHRQPPRYARGDVRDDGGEGSLVFRLRVSLADVNSQGGPLPPARKIFKTKEGGSQNIDSRGFVGKIFGIMGLDLTVGSPANWLTASGDALYFQWLAGLWRARIESRR